MKCGSSSTTPNQIDKYWNGTHRNHCGPKSLNEEVENQSNGKKAEKCYRSDYVPEGRLVNKPRNL